MCPAGVQGRGGASGPLRRAGEAVGIRQRAGRERGTARTGKLPAWIDATQYDGVFAVSEALCRALWMLKEDASYWHRAPSLTEKADTD